MMQVLLVDMFPMLAAHEPDEVTAAQNNDRTGKDAGKDVAPDRTGIPGLAWRSE
jgi:hypothetical protein